MDEATTGLAHELGGWWGSWIHHYGYSIGALATVLVIFALLRNVRSIQELALPLLDDVRHAVVSTLAAHRHESKERPEPTVLAAAILGGSLLCAVTLYAIVTLIAHLATPVG